MKDWRKGLRWVAGILALAALGMSASRLLRASPGNTPRAEDVAAAKRTAVTPGGERDEREPAAPPGTISGSGVVEPRDRQTNVSASVAGRITAVAVKEGQRVEAGDVLVELEDSVERAALAAAAADLAAARAQLSRVVRGSRAEETRAAIAESEAARSRADQARGVADRLRSLLASGSATADATERAVLEAEAARSTAAAAEARAHALLAGSRREDVQLAHAQADAAEARRDQAQAALDRLTVRAPISGEVLQVLVRAGEYSQLGSGPLVVIGDLSELRVRMDVDERDVARVALGNTVVVRANAFPGIEFSGKVVELGRRMGRKNVRTDDPTERNDTKILEAVVRLDPTTRLVVGQRVTCYVRES